jgi:hypothetical protein
MISFCFGAWSKVDIGYGKHINSLLKITIAPRLGWFIFEVPNLIMASYFFSTKYNNPINLKAKSTGFALILLP